MEGNMDDITPEEREEWKSIFDDFDTDGSGQLGREEIKQVMCCCKQNPIDTEIDDMMKASDKNADDKIDFEEFCIFMKQLPHPEESMREALGVFVENDKLSRERLKEILGADDADADGLLEAADLDKDGFIDQEEFIKLMQHTQDKA